VLGKSIEDTINKAHNTLSRLSAWFCAKKLSLRINKTSYSIFGQHANDEHNDIQEVNCCKYLGVYADNTLLWKNHIEYIHKKLSRFVGIFYKLGYKLNSQVLKTLYFSFIYPQLLYGVEIYANTNKYSKV